MGMEESASMTKLNQNLLSTLAIQRFVETRKVTAGIVAVFQVTQQRALLMVDKFRVFHFELELPRVLKVCVRKSRIRARAQAWYVPIAGVDRVEVCFVVFPREHNEAFDHAGIILHLKRKTYSVEVIGLYGARGVIETVATRWQRVPMQKEGVYMENSYINGGVVDMLSVVYRLSRIVGAPLLYLSVSLQLLAFIPNDLPRLYPVSQL